MFKDEFLNRMATGYLALLASVWFVSFGIADSAPTKVHAFFYDLRWLVTAPMIFVAIGVAIVFVISHESAKPPSSITLTIDIAQPVAPHETTRSPPKQLIIGTEPTKKEEPDPHSAEEKREAEEPLERPRFHPVNQTRSTQEALEASLDEF